MIVFTTFRWLLLPLVFAAQADHLTDFDQGLPPIAEQTSSLRMATIIARYPDGTPVKGFIFCDGYWFKYADEHNRIQGHSLQFRTDSRGAIIMNPSVADDVLTCYCEVGSLSGQVTVTLAGPLPRMGYIVLRPSHVSAGP